MAIPEFVLKNLACVKQSHIPTVTCPSPSRAANLACSLVVEVVQSNGLKCLAWSSMENEERAWVTNMLNQSQVLSTIHINKPIKAVVWKLRMGKEYFLSWRQNQGRSILFFDGASKDNPGAAGAGGIIYDPDGKEGNSFAWELGICCNNEAKSPALYMGLRSTNVRRNPKIISIGDSELIIKHMRKSYKQSNTRLTRSIPRIRKE